jgi:hypothetical protein
VNGDTWLAIGFLEIWKKEKNYKLQGGPNVSSLLL